MVTDDEIHRPQNWPTDLLIVDQQHKFVYYTNIVSESACVFVFMLY